MREFIQYLICDLVFAMYRLAMAITLSLMFYIIFYGGFGFIIVLTGEADDKMPVHYGATVIFACVAIHAFLFARERLAKSVFLINATFPLSTFAKALIQLSIEVLSSMTVFFFSSIAYYPAFIQLSIKEDFWLVGLGSLVASVIGSLFANTSILLYYTKKRSLAGGVLVISSLGVVYWGALLLYRLIMRFRFANTARSFLHNTSWYWWTLETVLLLVIIAVIVVKIQDELTKLIKS